MWVPAVFGVMPSVPGRLAGGRAPGDEGREPRPRVGSARPGPCARSAGVLAGRGQHRVDGVGVDAPARTSPRSSAAAALSMSAGRCGARFGHRVEGVSGGEDPRGGRDRRTGQAAVIAGAVEPLVGECGDGADPGQCRRSGERRVRCSRSASASAPTRSQVSGPGLSRIVAGTPCMPDVMHQTGAPHRRTSRPAGRATRRRVGGQLGDAREWPARDGERRSVKSAIASSAGRRARLGQPAAAGPGPRR